MKIEQVVIAIVIGALLWLWSGHIIIDCSRFTCTNTQSYHD